MFFASRAFLIFSPRVPPLSLFFVAMLDLLNRRLVYPSSNEILDSLSGSEAALHADLVVLLRLRSSGNQDVLKAYVEFIGTDHLLVNLRASR